MPSSHAASPYGLLPGPLLITAVLLAACTPLSMKQLPRGTAVVAKPVQAEVAFAASAPYALSIGSTKVGHIVATPIFAPGTSPYEKTFDPETRRYTFNAQDGSRALRADCSERVAERPILSLGKVKMDLFCSCRSGSAQTATLTLHEGRGEAVLPAQEKFTVWETYESQEGAASREPLGYYFRSERGVGALDVTRQPRAFVPSYLSPEQTTALSCLYASLLLHAPN